ncbi:MULTISPECIES: hypothetical protein [Streptomyces]|uniref:hypothetical protein n=1 Tax=Streptomyces TaxID=1883 RepID=UPI000D51B2E2|nr:hypothetical protein [Streptomyces sp. CS081A]PVC74717.1 hypothetical protein DBP18_11125 [Streptomyces sp. CS081A]
MRTALRTALATALVAGVAITAPAFTAGAAFAADGPSAAPTAPSAPTPAATTSAPTATTPVPTATATTPTGAEADAAKGILVRTETLLNGTVAKIYKVKQQNHRAELFRQGRPVGVLEAVTRPAAGQDNGEFFVLNPDGTTHNWVGNTAPNTPGVYRLVDGTVLELGRKDGRFGLQLIENGKGRGYTYVNGVRTVWTFGKAVVVLEQDGQFSAYVPGSPRQAAPEPYGTGGGRPTAPAPGAPVVLGECTVRQVVPSVFGDGWSVTLTHDLAKGPKAVLIDNEGKVQGTADRAHPFDSRVGLKIEGADTLAPRLGQRTQGGDTPFRWSAFPKLPKGCEKDDATPAPAPSATTGTAPHNAGQTTVVPKGGVAAGAEPGTGGDSTAPVAAGAGAASLAAAGLGFVVLRRRAAAARV